MSLNKKIEYKGYQFNIKLELNTKIEKSIQGKRFHRITINDTGHGSYYSSELIQDDSLEEHLNKIERLAREYVDSTFTQNSDIDKRLLKLGFS